MTLRQSNWRRSVLLAAVATGAAASTLTAQKKETQEFTRQGLLIVNFTPTAGTDMKLARRAADGVRSRVGKLVNRRDVDVIDGGEINYRMERAGYNADTALTLADIHIVGKYMRADEYLLATVSNGPNGPRISGELVLFRDERLRQPLPDAVAPKIDSAAALFARSLAAARAQLVPERRCENALREGSASRAIAAVREAITAYPRSTIARTCLVWAQRQNKTPAAEVLASAQAILDVDARNFHALEAAAAALDSLRKRDEAATHWLRLAATDTNDLDLAYRVIYSLLDGGNAKRAEPFVTALATLHPDDLRFTQQQWRAAYENKNWAAAIAAAEVLLVRDSVAQRDSVFFLRLGMAYRADNRPFKAVETLARGVATFPRDARLYSLYTQYVRAEADTVVPRGLALFPQSADLLALNAKDLRARGKIEASLDATKRALMLDSSMAQGQLMIAQLEIELGRPDSAIGALRRALAGGEDSALVAQFALSKGSVLYRAANGSKATADFSAALRMLSFADSVRSTDQSHFLTGAAALGVAQAVLTDASKLTDKEESCRLTRFGAGLISVARSGLQAGEQLFAEAAKQSLDYLGQLDPYAQQQLKAACGDPD